MDNVGWCDLCMWPCAQAFFILQPHWLFSVKFQNPIVIKTVVFESLNQDASFISLQLQTGCFTSLLHLSNGIGMKSTRFVWLNVLSNDCLVYNRLFYVLETQNKPAWNPCSHESATVFCVVRSWEDVMMQPSMVPVETLACCLSHGIRVCRCYF